jgi:hypothetical protein
MGRPLAGAAAKNGLLCSSRATTAKSISQPQNQNSMLGAGYPYMSLKSWPPSSKESYTHLCWESLRRFFETKSDTVWQINPPFDPMSSVDAQQM